MNTPKYVSNANRIIEAIASEPNQIWTKTQRELGEELGFSQPELSSLLKYLVEVGKIRRGVALSNVRGRNFTIELLDASPLDGSLRKPSLRKESEDRVLRPEEEVVGVINLESISLDHIGAAVVRVLKDYWSKEERFNAIRNEQIRRIKEYKDLLSDERTMRIRLANDKDSLQRQLQEKEEALTQLRTQLNSLLTKANKRRSGSEYKVRDMLDDDELKMLDNLMRGRPGHYRESDKEAGLEATG